MTQLAQIGGGRICTKCGNAQRGRCKPCQSARSRKYYESNKDTILGKSRAYREANRGKILAYREANKEVRREHYHETKASTWEKRALTACKSRAKRKNVPFAMQAADLYDASGQRPIVCPILGYRLDYEAGPDMRVWASIDRIVPALGYVSGNVRIISNLANDWKSNGSNRHEYLAILKKIKPKPRKAESGCLPLFESNRMVTHE